jgi:hypothetical protein
VLTTSLMRGITESMAEETALTRAGRMACSTCHAEAHDKRGQQPMPPARSVLPKAKR